MEGQAAQQCGKIDLVRLVRTICNTNLSHLCTSPIQMGGQANRLNPKDEIFYGNVTGVMGKGVVAAMEEGG